MTDDEFRNLEHELLLQLTVQKPFLHRLFGNLAQADAWAAIWLGTSWGK